MSLDSIKQICVAHLHACGGAYEDYDLLEYNM